jgi:MYXO-CTERM domain-containing protein
MRALILLLLPGVAVAAEPHRSFYDLPSSNGYGAVVVDLQQGRAHHWRDHLFATEEPVWNAAGEEQWKNNEPRAVYTRDLLHDAYFGLRVSGESAWLTDLPVDLDASGWGSPDGSINGGTNQVAMVQAGDGFVATTWVWSPWGIERSAMALVLEVENTGTEPLTDLGAFSVHNVHLGEGRPGPNAEIGFQNETVILGPTIEERGFAGVVAARPLLAADAMSGWYDGAAWENPFDAVAGGGGQVAAQTGNLGAHDDSVSYLQWDLGDLAPGETARVGVVLAHHPDPFAVDVLTAELEAWQGTRTVGQVLEREREEWQAFQDRLTPPTLGDEELALYRHSAAVLRMAQVRESSYWLREWLTVDGEERHSSFGALPGEVTHAARGSVLASLPPGRWTYAWPRDAAYAAAGMAHAGMDQEAADALRFVLNAVSDRYREYSELSGLPIEPYAVSLCRHHGFGVEESDTLGGGDFNFEFDGAGLTLWALGEYVRATGDWTLVESEWERLKEPTAGFLEALIDPETGLIAPDSSIWEHHWLGKERAWAYTSITAARGLCDAATFAEHMGDAESATRFSEAGKRIREGILASLVGADGVVAATVEELPFGGYYDGAVLEAVGMALLDPASEAAIATVDGVVEELQTDDGPGLSRNDDAWDAHDLSPWGSNYDSDEWVMIDLRAAVAARKVGREDLSDALIDWVTAQSTANYLAIGETYDPVSADYTNNAPMVGFGPGAWIYAVHQREGLLSIDAACGEWPVGPGDDDDAVDDDDAADDDDVVDDDDAADDDDSVVTGAAVDGCGCSGASDGASLSALALVLGISRRRRKSTGKSTA